jgi:hypothetical protein
MKEKTIINKSDISENKDVKANPGQQGGAHDIVKNNPGLELLAAEGNNDLINYIEWLGLDRDPNLVVLSSVHHYYYDLEEMKNVKTVVNLIQLNQVRDIKNLFHSVYHILSPKCNFIGYFFDSKKHNGSESRNNPSDSKAVENSILSKIPLLNKIYDMIDSKTNKNMSGNGVSQLLEEYGFMVLDMTELNGLTYFHAKKIQTTGS